MLRALIAGLLFLGLIGTIQYSRLSRQSNVVLGGEILFNVRWGDSVFTPEQRAEAISARIKSVADNPSVEPAVAVVAREGLVEIRLGDTVLASVFENDARAYGLSQPILAQMWAHSIESGIAGYRGKYAPRQRLIRLLGGLTLLLAAGAIIWAIRRYIPHSGSRMELHLHAELTRRKSQLLDFIPNEDVARLVGTVFRSLRMTLQFLVALAAVEGLLLLLPEYRHAALLVLNQLTGSLSNLGKQILDQVPSLILITIIIVVAAQVLRLVHLFFARVAAGGIDLEGFRPAWASTTDRLVSIGIIVLAALIAYPYIPGSESASFKAVSLFLGALVSLGSTGLVGNVIAGIVLTYMDSFQTGDFVRIGETTGYIAKTSLFTTRVRTYNNRLITIPNSLVMAGSVVNYSSMKEQGLVITTTVGVGYDAAWRQVEAMLLTAADRTEGIARDRSAFVVTPSLNQFNVTYELNAYLLGTVSPIQVRSSLNRNILDLFNEYSVQLMTPSFEANPAQPVVVPKDRWNAPPTLNRTASVETNGS